MSRSKLATHFGLALLAFGALVLASLTLGFAGSAAERVTNTNVVDDDSSYLAVDFQGEGSDGTTFEEAPNGNISDNEFLLVNVTNQLNSELTHVTAEFEEGKWQSKLVFGNDSKSVNITKTPKSLEQGETGQIYAECTEEGKDTYPVVISASGEGQNESVAIKRDVTIDCSKKHIVEGEAN